MKKRKSKSGAAYRLQRVIEGDRLHLPADYVSLIGYDAEKLLGEYFVLSRSPEITVEGREGKYEITLRAKAERVKGFGLLPQK